MRAGAVDQWLRGAHMLLMIAEILAVAAADVACSGRVDGVDMQCRGSARADTRFNAS